MLPDETIVLGRFAQSLIRRKVKALVGRAGYTDQDREDLQQELIQRLLHSLDLFDPDRAHPNAFITTVVNRAVARLLRDRLAKKRHTIDVRSLESLQHDDGAFEPPDHRSTFSGGSHSDLIMDLAEVVAAQPVELRELAERLKRQSTSEVARDLGVARSTIQRRIRRLQKPFEDAGLRIYL